MTLRDRQIGDVTILDIDGRMTLEDGVDIFRAVVRQLLALSRIHLILNLHDVPYIDSTALGEIIRVHTSVMRRGGGLRLLHVTPPVKQLLVVTKLLPAFHLRDDEAEAVKSFAVPQMS
jgi:anti-anti-sigma factor